MIGTVEPEALSGPGLDRLNRRDGSFIVILALCTIALYFRTAFYSFVAFDDQLYVFSNTYMQQGLSTAALRWAMTATPNGNWHPLTTVAQLCISTLFGLNPGAYHLVNVALQATNGVLLYLFLRRTTRLAWPAFFTALLWEMHPMRVESVAWISELKDVMCGVFWLGALLAYQNYTVRRTAGRYSIVVLLYILSMLGKPMSVTLPAALLLLDYWPLSRTSVGNSGTPARRWWCWRVLEKLPLLALAFLDTAMQKHRLTFNSTLLPFSFRLQNGLVAYACYLRDYFFPHHLSIFYPHPDMLRQTIPLWQLVVSITVLVVISGLAILRRGQTLILSSDGAGFWARSCQS